MKQLRIALELMALNPKIHIGGSFGILLHGFDLGRNLMEADLDMTFDGDDPDEIILPTNANNISAKGRSMDMTLSVMIEGVKVDIQCNPEMHSVPVMYYGNQYNVTKLSDTLMWKKKYADEGHVKHKNDLKLIYAQLIKKHDNQAELSGLSK